MYRLTSDDREFFSLVAQAAFANPFGSERLAIDRKLSGTAGGDLGTAVVGVLAQLRQRLAVLDTDNSVKLSDLSQTDRNVLRYVFLFDTYHKFVDRFDALILAQAAAGDEPVKTLFASELISQLLGKGFDEAAAKKYLAVFFQMRRAFYFINRSLIGASESMRALRMNLWNNIFTCDIGQYEELLWNRMEDFSTLLLGPTGCGKGAAAAAIGQSGFIPYDAKTDTFVESFTKAFVSINLSQYPETLIESELFGHTRGAFTGAASAHDGIFALCSRHGSIFLDEIGELSTQVQIKLLQILQERTFSPVGSHQKIKFSGRVIAATNQSLEMLRMEGKFRDDFYYRLCGDCIEVPCLCQRIHENPAELGELVTHTVGQITGRESPQLAQTVLEVIHTRLGKDYAWPGNVRELAQCVRRVIIKRDYQGYVSLPVSAKDAFLTQMQTGQIDAENLLAGYCTMLYKRFGNYEEVARRTGLDRRTVKKYLGV
jgi:DNA-binding NtrC family response regulator